MNLKIKIDFKKISMFFVVISLFEPILFYHFDIMNYIYGGVMCAFFCFYLLEYKRSTISPVLFFLVLNRLILIILTIKNDGDIEKCLFYTINFVLLYFVYDYYSKQQLLDELISVIQFTWAILLTINLFLSFKWPEGFLGERLFLLGYRTRFTDYAFALIVISLYKYIKTKNTAIFMYCCGISVANLIYKWVATGILAIGLFFIFIFISKKIFLYIKQPRFSWLFLASLVLTVGVVKYRVQEYFAWLIEGVLKRNITLTYRTYLWDRSVDIIKENLWFGVGMTKNNGNFVWNDWSYTQAHNQILQSLYESGIWGTIFLLLFIFLCGKNLDLKLKDQNVFAVAIFVYMVIMIVEIYMYYAPVYAVIMLACFIAKNNEHRILGRRTENCTSV